MIRHAFSRTPLDTANRLLNIGAAAVLLIVTGPLLLLVALLIYFESTGPVLDKQASLNREGRRFQELNFRVVQSDKSRRNWPGDITRVGWFLLFTRIVTLPQLINVVRGDISLTEMHDSSSFLWK
jgi:lipopolysaccharide/colanic/teichoic acid biosynthesis glycosyltransferase